MPNFLCSHECAWPTCVGFWVSYRSSFAVRDSSFSHAPAINDKQQDSSFAPSTAPIRVDSRSLKSPKLSSSWALRDALGQDSAALVGRAPGRRPGRRAEVGHLPRLGVHAPHVLPQLALDERVALRRRRRRAPSETQLAQGAPDPRLRFISHGAELLLNLRAKFSLIDSPPLDARGNAKKTLEKAELVSL